MKTNKVFIMSFLIIMLGISGLILWPYSIKRWATDRPLGTLHIFVAISIGLASLIAIILIFKKACDKNGVVWKNIILKTIFLYLIIEVIVGICQGLLGVIIYKLTDLSYDTIKQGIFIGSTGIQSLVRLMIEFFLFFEIMGSSINGNKANVKIIVCFALLMTVISMILCLLPNGNIFQLIQIIWNTFYLISIWISLEKIYKG